LDDGREEKSPNDFGSRDQANGFGLTTTAEGIEDTTQLTYLKANGCSEGQGYLFGKAIPAEDIPMLLKPSPSDRAVAWREGPSIEAA
jgi:predicted signal transduction protein with EAL and GGDEF domain